MQHLQRGKQVSSVYLERHQCLLSTTLVLSLACEGKALPELYAGVIIKSYDVIYELLNDVRELMEGRLGAIEERIPLGQAEVRAVFGSGSKKVAGCHVDEGSLKKGCLVAVGLWVRSLHLGRKTFHLLYAFWLTLCHSMMTGVPRKAAAARGKAELIEEG